MTLLSHLINQHWNHVSLATLSPNSRNFLIVEAIWVRCQVEAPWILSPSGTPSSLLEVWWHQVWKYFLVKDRGGRIPGDEVEALSWGFSSPTAMDISTLSA